MLQTLVFFGGLFVGKVDLPDSEFAVAAARDEEAVGTEQDQIPNLGPVVGQRQEAVLSVQIPELDQSVLGRTDE